MWIDDLALLIPPPPAEERTVTIEAGDWKAAEQKLGRPFPPDFKQFVETWGPGYIGNFVAFYTPTGNYSTAILLPAAVERPAKAYAELKQNWPAKYALPDFPADGSLMTAGVTDNGDYVGWIVSDAPPETWPVAVWGDEDGMPQVFEGVTFGPFLVGLVTGSIRPEAFPPQLWNDTPLGFTVLPQKAAR